MQYPTINPNVIVSEQSDLAIDLVTGKTINLPSGAYPVLKLIDGQTDVDAICNKLMASYKTSRDNICNFIANMSKLGFILLSYTPQSVLHESKLPIRVASVELTERCNLRCRYCYGAFAPDKYTNLSYKDAVQLFSALKKRGLNNIELTGGEPTVNPEFDEILSEACRQFSVVTVMTNAVVLRDSTLDIYKEYRNKINFSISIDGFTEETNSFQRGVRNTFKLTVDHILRIKREVNPKYCRVVYMLTNENVNEVDNFFEFMLAHNIKDLIISIPENIDKGRTYKLADGCMMSDRKSKSRTVLVDKVNQIDEKYGKRIHTAIDRMGTKGMQMANAIPSCGAGWTMLSFQANGNVQPCNMMGTGWRLGNFRDDPNLDFLSFKNPLYKAFATLNLSAENSNRAVCSKCEYNEFCGKCINKIFMANHEKLLKGMDLCPILQRTKVLKDFFCKID